MTELLVIRHGETDWNLQQRWQGQIDVPLNATGRAQAARLAARLAGDAHDLLVCSDLLRAQQTAAPLAQAWGLAPQRERGWREQSFGILEGLDRPTIEREHPQLWTQWREHAADFALPQGGESMRHFHHRVLEALRALMASEAARTARRITVVTHGGVLDVLWRASQNLPLDGLRTCAIPNTGLNRLQWDGAALRILSWGDAAHLEAAAPSD